MSLREDVGRMEADIASLNRRLTNIRNQASIFDSGCIAYLSANMINPGAGLQKILFDSVDFDLGNDFDTVNNKFVVRYSGYYFMICCLYMGGIVDQSRYWARIHIDTALKQQVAITASGVTNQSAVCPHYAYLTAGQEIEGYTSCPDGGTDIIGGGNSISTFLSVELRGKT